jgi:hypothetical protein
MEIYRDLSEPQSANNGSRRTAEPKMGEDKENEHARTEQVSQGAQTNRGYHRMLSDRQEDGVRWTNPRQTAGGPQSGTGSGKGSDTVYRTVLEDVTHRYNSSSSQDDTVMVNMESDDVAESQPRTRSSPQRLARRRSLGTSQRGGKRNRNNDTKSFTRGMR